MKPIAANINQAKRTFEKDNEHLFRDSGDTKNQSFLMAATTDK